MTREYLKLTKPFEIFQPGTWHGTPYGYGDQFPITTRIDNAFSNFEAGRPRMNLIRGHNTFEEKPALGWVLALSKKGAKGKVLATARNVDMELVDDIKNERYPMRSVEIFHNWKSKGMAITGIAFLGSNPPEVDGMEDMQLCTDTSQRIFCAKRDDRILVAFEWGDSLEEDLGKKFFFAPGGGVSFAGGRGELTVVSQPEMLKHMGSISEDLTPEDDDSRPPVGTSSLSSKNKGKGGEVQMTKEEMDKAIADALAKATPVIISQFKASDDYKGLVAANEELKAELSATRTEATASAVQAKFSACATFAKSLLDQKRITPAVHEAGLAAALASLDDTQKFKFAGDKEETQLQHFKGVLSALPTVAVSLFAAQDTDPARPNEDIDGAVAKFAAENGLDPALVAIQFAQQKSAKFGAGSPDADGFANTNKGISIAAQPKAKAA